MYAYIICMFALPRVNMCVCAPVFARVCVCLLNAAGFRSWLASSVKRERSHGGKDKNERVQSSEADDCVFVRVNLFITDAREISIEMILVTDSPWISPMADTQNVYVYRTRGESRKGQWCEKERGRVRSSERANMRNGEIIREVRLGRIKHQGKKIGGNVEKR